MENGTQDSKSKPFIDQVTVDIDKDGHLSTTNKVTTLEVLGVPDEPTIVPETATEQAIYSIVELAIWGIGLILVCLYIKFRDSKFITSLKLDPVTVISFILTIIGKSKHAAAVNVVKKARENNIKVDMLDKNFTKEDIKNIGDNIVGQARDTLHTNIDSITTDQQVNKKIDNK